MQRTTARRVPGSWGLVLIGRQLLHAGNTFGSQPAHPQPSGARVLVNTGGSKETHAIFENDYAPLDGGAALQELGASRQTNCDGS
jgi:hypothetical protein